MVSIPRHAIPHTHASMELAGPRCACRRTAAAFALKSLLLPLKGSPPIQRHDFVCVGQNDVALPVEAGKVAYKHTPISHSDL